MSTLNLLLSAVLMAVPPSSMAVMRWEKRILLVSAPDARDSRLNEQRRIMKRWKAEAEDRDLVVVEIVSGSVTGASDDAAALRKRYRMPAGDFSIALIGKDGGIKLHKRQPITAETLEGTIDAMPMRRGGAR